LHTISFQKLSIGVEAQSLISLEISLDAILDADLFISRIERILSIDAALETNLADLVDGDS